MAEDLVDVAECEQLVAMSRRADTEPTLRDALIKDAGSALAEQQLALPDCVRARAEYHQGYGLYIEIEQACARWSRDARELAPGRRAIDA